MYNATHLVYTELKEDFNYFFPSVIMYKCTCKLSDIQFIGDKVFKQYFPDGTLNDPMDAVKVNLPFKLNVNQRSTYYTPEET